MFNARLAAAITCLCGYDAKDPHVRWREVAFIAVASNAQRVTRTVGSERGLSGTALSCHVSQMAQSSSPKSRSTARMGIGDYDQLVGADEIDNSVRKDADAFAADK